MGINFIALEGRIKFEPNFTSTKNGKTKVQFKIGVERLSMNGQSVSEDDYDCIYFADDGMLLEDYLKVNTRVVVTGMCEMPKWQDKTTNKWSSKFQVLVRELRFLNTKNIAKSAKMESSTNYNDDGIVDLIPDDDLPF